MWKYLHACKFSSFFITKNKCGQSPNNNVAKKERKGLKAKYFLWRHFGGTVLIYTRDAEAEAVEAVKRLWKRKYFEEKSWKRKQIRSIWLFEEPEAEAFFIKYGACRNVEAESNSETFDFLRIRKRKHFSKNMGQGCGSGSGRKG